MQRSQEGWAVAIGICLVVAVALGWLGQIPAALPWDIDPRASLPLDHALKLLALMATLTTLMSLGVRLFGGNSIGHWFSSIAVVSLAVLARVLNHQTALRQLALPDALVALCFGLLSHRVFSLRRDAPPAGTQPGLWLSLGVTLLGAEVVMPKLLAFGLPGIVIVSVVTPLVIVAVWMIGTRALRITMSARPLLLAMVSAVGGVSSVLLTGVASRARQHEMAFGVLVAGVWSALLTHALPPIASTLALAPRTAGIWFGSTNDPEHAVVAARSFGNAFTLKVANAVADVQVAMLGLVGLMLAIFWITSVLQQVMPSSKRSATWRDFPAAIVGLLVVSVVTSFVLRPLLGDEALNELARATKELRLWAFCLAAAAFGLEVRPRLLVHEADGGRTFALLAVGLALDLGLTLLVSVTL